MIGDEIEAQEIKWLGHVCPASSWWLLLHNVKLNAHHGLAQSATPETVVFTIYCPRNYCFLTCDTLSPYPYPWIRHDDFCKPSHHKFWFAQIFDFILLPLGESGITGLCSKWRSLTFEYAWVGEAIVVWTPPPTFTLGSLGFPQTISFKAICYVSVM